jgi:hypothetical protein
MQLFFNTDPELGGIPMPNSHVNITRTDPPDTPYEHHADDTEDRCPLNLRVLFLSLASWAVIIGIAMAVARVLH